jgi:hypothetical protein
MWCLKVGSRCALHPIGEICLEASLVSWLQRVILVTAEKALSPGQATRAVFCTLINLDPRARIFGCIFLSSSAGPPSRQWMWASGHGGHHIERAAHGYEPTREAAREAFAKSWRRAL